MGQLAQGAIPKAPASTVSKPWDAVERAADRMVDDVLGSSGRPISPAGDTGTIPSGTGESGMVLRQAAPVDQRPAEAPAPPAQPGDVVDGWVVYETEARKGGTLAWRNNNPGNLVAGAFATAHGAYAGKRNGRFAVFTDHDTGFAAIRALLVGTYGSRTLADTMTAYAPASDNNDPVAYANQISNQTGLDSGRTISSLTDAELDSVARVIERMEGTRAGTVVPRTDTRLPARARLPQAPDGGALDAGTGQPVLRHCRANEGGGVVCDDDATAPAPASSGGVSTEREPAAERAAAAQSATSQAGNPQSQPVSASGADCTPASPVVRPSVP